MHTSKLNEFYLICGISLPPCELIQVGNSCSGGLLDLMRVLNKLSSKKFYKQEQLKLTHINFALK